MTTTSPTDPPTGCPPECRRRPGRRRQPIAASVRAAVYARDGWRRKWCDAAAGDQSRPVLVWVPKRLKRYRNLPDSYRTYAVHLTLHHLYAHTLGGCDHAHNLLTLCNQCNSEAGVTNGE